MKTGWQLVADAEMARSRRRLNEHYLARLRERIAAPSTELPLLFKPTLGQEELRVLSERLEKDVT